MPSISISRSVKGHCLPVSNTGSRCSSASRCRRYLAIFRPGTLIVNTGDLEASAERFQNEARARFENRGVDPMRPLLPPELLWLRSDELFGELKKWPRVQLKTEAPGGQSGEYQSGLPDAAGSRGAGAKQSAAG